jgi:hypothetical protein
MIMCKSIIIIQAVSAVKIVYSRWLPSRRWSGSIILDPNQQRFVIPELHPVSRIANPLFLVRDYKSALTRITKHILTKKGHSC